MSLITNAARLTASSTALIGATSWSVAATGPHVHTVASDAGVVAAAELAPINHLVYIGPTFRIDETLELDSAPNWLTAILAGKP